MEPTLKFSVMGYSNDQCYMRPPMFVLFCRTNYRLLVVEHEKKAFYNMLYAGIFNDIY